MGCLENGQVGRSVPLSVLEEHSRDLEIAITQLLLTEVLNVMAYLQKFRRVTSKDVEVGNCDFVSGARPYYG